MAMLPSSWQSRSEYAPLQSTTPEKPTANGRAQVVRGAGERGEVVNHKVRTAGSACCCGAQKGSHPGGTGSGQHHDQLERTMKRGRRALVQLVQAGGFRPRTYITDWPECGGGQGSQELGTQFGIQYGTNINSILSCYLRRRSKGSGTLGSKGIRPAGEQVSKIDKGAHVWWSSQQSKYPKWSR